MFIICKIEKKQNKFRLTADGNGGGRGSDDGVEVLNVGYYSALLNRIIIRIGVSCSRDTDEYKLI